tara:strand:+ start:659 stop:1495 length:837 start_codon:yes stop_codon:yes gene_type:complete
MKTLFENWRAYEEKVLLQENVVDYIKSGFSKLINMPEKFDQLVQKTRQNFTNIYIEKLSALAQTDQMQEIGKDIADKIMQNSDPQTLKEEWTSDSSKKQFSLEDLASMGVGKETIELVAHTMADQGAESLIEAAEGVVEKVMPPKVKDWLMRFVSKFIGAFVFGFIDNFIMVIAGGHIDAQFGGVAGAMVGTAGAPMLAAGFGNTVSDAVGELASNTIEGAMDKMGLDPEAVTDEEVAAGPMWMRFLDKQASVIGIVVGCLVGLFPLFLEEQNIETPI